MPFALITIAGRFNAENSRDINAKGQESMRDDLALYLFRSQNLSVLADNGEFCPFSFLFPYVMVTIAIQSENLTNDSRYQLVKTAFNVILLLRQNAKGFRSRTNKKVHL